MITFHPRRGKDPRMDDGLRRTLALGATLGLAGLGVLWLLGYV